MGNINPRSLACTTCDTKVTSLVNNLSPEETEKFSSAKTCNYYKKQQGVFLEGAFPRGVFCIHDGKVKVFRRGEMGKEQIIHIATRGEILGYRALFGEEPYNVSAETLEESHICYVPREDFLDMLDHNMTLRHAIMKELSKELSLRTTMITNMAQKSVRERLAFSLVFLQNIYENEPIKLSREDMANFVGTATETLIRLITEFKEDGYIESQGRKIQVINKEGLIRLAGK